MFWIKVMPVIVQGASVRKTIVIKGEVFQVRAAVCHALNDW